MHPMFAEDIGGWLVAGGLLFGGLAASILALFALAPASRGKPLPTLVLISPAVIIVIFTTGWLVQAYFRRDYHDHEEVMENYVNPWFLMAFLPLAASLTVSAVLCCKIKKGNSDKRRFPAINALIMQMRNGCTEDEFAMFRCPICSAPLTLSVHPQLHTFSLQCSANTLHLCKQEAIVNAPDWWRSHISGGWID